MKIGVFDSGVGGLNVLKELIRAYPNHHYIYYGDTLNVPYGNKTKNELLDLSLKIIRFFEEKKVDLIIIACGTISSNCYLDLKDKTKIKLIDIITPTINYLNNSNFSNIGLIGTTRTIESKVFETKIIDKNLICKDTPSFVPMIENNEILKKKDVVINELMMFRDKVECLVLGCTHYPLLKEVIEEKFTFNLIDMGECLVNSLKLDGSGEKKIELYFSLLNDNILNNINKIIGDEKIVLEI